jgi:TctA family transporter
VDTIGLSIIIASHVGITICAVAAGAFAKSNVRVAEKFITANYLLWFVLAISVSCPVIYCGSRLIKTLQSHIKRFNTSNERFLNIKNGIFKVRF